MGKLNGLRPKWRGAVEWFREAGDQGPLILIYSALMVLGAFSVLFAAIGQVMR